VEKPTLELANKLNNTVRFLTASVVEDKSLLATMDVSTVGGLNQKNFAYVRAQWSAAVGA
jgi:hypothetical protein